MDKFGYYFAAGHKTYSKLAARELGRTTWHFNDEVFSSIDTTKEPDPSLWSLYMQRARQIREKYDYVVLMYSGGSDSSNALEAFLAADCKIDELCFTWDYPTTGLINSFHNAEIFNVILPRIAGLHIKTRDIDITPLIQDAFLVLDNHFEYFVNHHMSPNNVAKQFIRHIVPEWKKIIDSGKKLVLVWGVEKPIVLYKSGKFYLTFRDMVDNCVGPYTFRHDGWYDEFFYWTPDMPEIPIKQAHVIKNYCLTTTDPGLFVDSPTDCGYSPTLQKHLSYDGLKCVIYPKWDPNTFCNGKSPSMIYSMRDQFFFAGNVNVDRYRQIVDSMYKQLNDATPLHNRFTLSPMTTRLYEI